MKNTILTEDDYLQFYKAILYGKIDDVVFSSVKASYKDLCRTITGFAKEENHDQIYESSVKYLVEQIKSLLNITLKTQDEFDSWHKQCCDNLIDIFKPQKFYYGQAQKWINMSLKNLSMLNHKMVKNNYEFFHVPLDNFIFKETGKKTSVSWSKINDYEEYLHYQIWFRKTYDGIPVDIEFKMWLKASRNIDA